MPGGSEFPSFLDTIVDISRNEVLFTDESVKLLRKLKEDVRIKVFVTSSLSLRSSFTDSSVKLLRKLKEDVRIKVFVTPTCPYCPGMARAAYQMALANPRIKAE